MRARLTKALALCAAAAAVLVFASPAAAAAPNTKITSGPSGFVATRSVTFKFKASVAGARFKCKLDGGAWSLCTSPKTYSSLPQGAHTFRVRAIKNGVADPTPATRTFTVDTVKPRTTILAGPEGFTEEHSPTFTFEANELATFDCKLDGTTFEPCTSPYSPSAPLIDGFYTFRVRARDQAGNVDGTPATREFDAETLITEDVATAEAAAQLYFPDTVDIDAPASCGGSTEVDCVNGVPLPPADQIHVTATRAGQLVEGAHRYDLTATLSVSTLQPIQLTYSGAHCTVTLTSANGTSPTWTFTVQLGFVVDAITGERRIVPSNNNLTGLESADYALSGDFICTFGGAFIPAGFLQDQLEEWFANYWICAAPGPAYLDACPAP